MRHSILAVFLAVLTTSTARADGFEYQFDMDGIADTIVYLAYHYGDKQYIADTVLLDGEGRATIAADTVLPAGVYMMVFPSLQNTYFEFVVNEPRFSVTGNVDDLVSTLRFKNSKENAVMYDDLRFLSERRKLTEPLSEQLQTLEPGSAEATKAREAIQALDDEVKVHRESIYKTHGDLLYTKLLMALREPEVPDAPMDADGNITDSLFQFRSVRGQALEFLDWNDEGLLRTPVVYNVMYRYLNNYSYRTPDSLMVSADNILAKARVNKEVFRYALIWLLNEYANSKIMGMDAVYVHLAMNYYDKGDAWWLADAPLYRIVDRAKRMKPTLIGETAPNIIMKDVNGRTRNLAELNSDYVIVYFWDPDCSHCREETPVLQEEFERLKVAYNIQVFSVNTQLEIEKWLKFIDKHSLGSFINVADFDQDSNFRSLYDISGTPALFLLDKDKHIIAKRLVSDQLFDFLGAYESEQKRSK